MLWNEKTGAHAHVISTHNTMVLSSQKEEMVTSALGDCNHNKCSSIMQLLKGHTEAFIKTVGSDIVISTIHHYQNFNS